MELTVRPVLGIGEVRPGDDLAAMITAAAPWLVDGDVLVVTSKIISKAEGQLVAVPTGGPEREAAREEVLADQTARRVARRGQTRIVATHHGFVMASAGIDASNVDRGHLVLLPVDPDSSARALRTALRERHGLDVAVIVSDTMGRPWRTGLTDVALGAAGIAALRDYRGERDAFGNELHITQMAVIDELCAAAELVKGKYDQVPVAAVRGFAARGEPDGPGAAALVRDVAHDLFSLGTAEARAAGQRDAASLPEAQRFAEVPVEPALLRRTLDLLGAASLRLAEAGARDKLTEQVVGAAEVVLLVAAGPDPVTCARAGADGYRLRVALAAEGLATAWLPADPARIADLTQLPGFPVAALAVGYPGQLGPQRQ
ncbi:MAG: coenzyme F420-0:L-glutamate ligase / coenzyme F420:gamma-L-glutamate ligase [Micromonosporaceae bacterium]